MIARPRRVGVVLTAVVAMGCGLVSGASDLEVVADGPTTGPDGGDATPDVTRAPPDGSTKDGGADVSVDALPPSRLREVTFESGKVEVPGGDGVDDLDGEAVVQSANVLRGSRSLALQKGRVTVKWPEQAEVWVRWVSLRESTVAATPIAELGPLTIDMVAAGGDRAQIRVRIGTTVAATSPSMKVAKVPLQVGLHFKKGVTDGVIEVWADAGPGQSAQLGAPFLSQATASVTFPLSEVVLETADGTETILDDIRVDNASMPP